MPHHVLTYEVKQLYSVLWDTMDHLLYWTHCMHAELMFTTYSTSRSTCSRHVICAAVKM